jgi:hypothetical protein
MAKNLFVWFEMILFTCKLRGCSVDFILMWTILVSEAVEPLPLAYRATSRKTASAPVIS